MEVCKTGLWLSFWLIWLFPTSHLLNSGPIYMCDNTTTRNSKIYCEGGPGSILDTIFVVFDMYSNDSKDFVDSPLRKPPDVTLAEFNQIDKSNKSMVEQFISDHFLPPGFELNTCLPEDWTEYPEKIRSIRDPNYQQFALDIHALWKDLCRCMNTTILKDADLHSLLYVPNPFIIPGGRFREYYYWDTYWIIRGLLISEMYTTAKHMILNLASMVAKYGFVPNGGRVYYLRRSQPPMLIGMVNQYYAATRNVSILSEKVGNYTLYELLDREFNFWFIYRPVTGQTLINYRFLAFQYHTTSNTPRPESYDKDVETAKYLPEDQRPQLYQDLASAAESGWDFSSRWMRDSMHLESTSTTQVVPVDLNAILCANARIMLNFSDILGEASKAGFYREMYTQLQTTMDQLFWREDIGAWFDFRLDSGYNTKFYPSVAVPLFAGCYDGNVTRARRVYNYLNNSGAFNYTYGIPTSSIDTEQQWDFPNAWPPLVHMVIEGLRLTQDPVLQEAAFHIADVWVQTNYEQYRDSKFMFEKYNVVNGSEGHGGEYSPQTGFGWTNGVMLDLLYTYGNRLKPPPEMPSTYMRSSFVPNTTGASSFVSNTGLVINFVVSVLMLLVF